MFINRLSELKNAGVWKDFTSAEDLKLAPRTLIYGFNGSGKTTLSRVISSIERGILEERLPAEIIFKIEASDGTIVSQDLISNPFGINLLVFNTDFVSRNFQWDSSSTKGIAYLSEKKVEARKEFDEIAPKLAAAKQKAKAKENAKAKADNDLSVFKTRVARNIREVASSSTYTQSYDARKIQGHYSKTSFSPEKKLSEDDLKKHQGVLAQREPLPTLPFFRSLPEGLVDWFEASQSLLTQSVSGIAVKEFEAHSDALRWVEEGLYYHDEHSVTDCLLCGNPLSEERRAQLRALFDKSWTEALSALEGAVNRGQEHQHALRELYRSIPKEAEITAEEREAFTKDRTTMEAAIKRLGVCVGELLKGLEVRVANPTKEVLINGELASFDLEEWLEEYATIEIALAETMKKHNDAFTSFAALQKDAFTKIETHVLATNQADWDRLQKDVRDAVAEQATARAEEKGLADRQLELRNDLHDVGVGADKMNELIWAYLGHKELRLVAEDGGYKILRPSGKPATELSEGEHTAVSFCYFLTQLAAEGRKLEDLVLVIDDPISSLDTAARTYAYSLMTRMTKKCAQVIVLTHNTSFMNMVKRELAGLEAIGPVEPVNRSFARGYRFPPQETKLRPGKGATVPVFDGPPVSVSITDMHRKARQITVKAGPGKAHLLSGRVNLHPDWPLDPKPIPGALRDVIADQCGPRAYRAVYDLLSRAAPRLKTGPLMPVADPVVSTIAAVGAMDETVLPIQGPPGTGKTYVTARAILSLVRNGARVGVTSNSHEAIRNVLMGCLAALEDADIPISLDLVHKTSGEDDGYPDDCLVRRTTSNNEAADGQHVVGATAWFFSRDENVQTFDWLFVDEAGQVGLANMVAMGRSARNLVLVGDPRQLPQVIQGAHPEPANLSCLEWMLGDHATVPPDRGIFLPVSRRMHPEVCRFISDQVYEGRLNSHPDTARQVVRGTRFPEAGAFWVPVPHEGNAQIATEEVAAISATVADLLEGTWTDKDGTSRRLQPRDIIVVAPYNAQVNALRDALPDAIRVGTVDKFQGQEAPVCLVSMTASSAEETSRGMEFLFSLNRINVAVSRAQGLALVFGAPRLRETKCETVEQMRLVNTLCALPERGVNDS